MMKKENYIYKLLIVTTIMCIVMFFFLLTGANTISPVGRYQLEVVMRRDFPNLFVIDTSTGRVKWLDTDDENKAFDKIKSGQ